MNWVFFLLIFVAYTTSLWQHLISAQTVHPMQMLTDTLLRSANSAVTLSLGLVGILAFFMGLMKILEDAGVLQSLARLLYPILKWLFPDIPANHPAFGAIAMNFSANMVGLGNAATPFGLKAMQELEKLNPHPGIATNAMVLFLAINTSSLTLIPTKVIALRASAGSADAAGIISTTLVATLCSTLVAILAAKLLQKLFATPTTSIDLKPSDSHDFHKPRYSHTIGVTLVAFSLFLGLIGATLYWGKELSPWIIPTLVVMVLGWGLIRKVDIYSSFTEGAKSGFDIALKIIPFLVAMLVAIELFRTSGAMDAITRFLAPYTAMLGIPEQALPMVFMRPLSGSGSLAVLSDILHHPDIGPDSYIGYLVSTMMGSTETTFYVLAVYFGSIQIRKIRHALAAGLLAEFTGMLISVLAVQTLLLNH
jgi:spore maturation protein SpmA